MKKLNILISAIRSEGLDEVIAYMKSKSLDFSYKIVDRKLSFRKALNDKEWELVLIDDSLVSMSIEDSLSLLMNEKTSIPGIVLFEKADESKIVKAMRYGASDVVIKTRPERLIPAIQNSVKKERHTIIPGEAENMLGKYDFILNTSHSLISLIDKDYSYKAVNDSFRDAHNLDKKEILGRKLSDIWGEKKFKEFIKPKLDACFSNEEIQYEAWFETPSMGLRYFRVSYFPFINKEGEVINVIVKTVDITKEKKMEDKIARGEGEMISIMENTKDIFWSLDREYRLIYANQSFQEFLYAHYSKRLENGSILIDFLPAHEQEVWKKHYDECFKGTGYSFEQSYLSEKGMTIYEVRLNPVYSDNKEITGVSCFARDISQRFKNEEKIRSQAEDLSLINKLNNAVNAGFSIQKIIEILNTETGIMFGGFGVFVFMLSDDNSMLIPVRTNGLNKAQRIFVSYYGLSEDSYNITLKKGSHYFDVINSGKPVLADDPDSIRAILKDYIDINKRSKKSNEPDHFLELNSIFSIPLISGNKILGVFNIARKTYFSGSELSRLRAIAEQLSSILKRKIDEDRVVQSENKFRNIFEDANDSIFILKDNIFVDCNAKTLELFRCKKEEIIGKTPVDYSPEFQFDGRRSEEKAKGMLDMAYRGKSARFEWLHKKKDGTEFYTDVSLTTMFFNNEIFLQAIVRDITIRKESEKLLVESEERFRAVFEDAVDAIFLIDPGSGKVVDINNTAVKLLNKPREQIITAHFSVNHPSEQVKRLENIFSGKSEDKPENILDVIYILPKGQEKIPVEVQAKKISISGRELIQASFWDISEKIKAQVAQKETEVKFETLFMQGHFAMLLEDGDGELIQVNKAFEKLFGYKRRELTKAVIYSLTHPADLERSKEYMTRMKNGEIDSFNMVKRYINKKGEDIWGHTGCTVIKDSNNSITNVIIMIVDISQQKKIEKQNIERTEDLSLINKLNLYANKNFGLESILNYFSMQIYSLFRGYSFRLLLWDSRKKEFRFRYFYIPKNTSPELKNLILLKRDQTPLREENSKFFYKMFSKKTPWLVDSRTGILRMIKDVMNTGSNQKEAEKINKLLNIKSIINFPLYIGEEILGHAICISPQKADESKLNRLSNIIYQFTGILKRKLVEEEELKLFTVMEQLNETVVITNTQGEIQYANMACEKSSGYSRSEAIGKTPSMFKSGKQSNEFYNVLWSTINAGDSWSGNIINKKKDGSLYTERVNITPVKDESGVISNFVAVKRDITRESMLEFQLRQSQKLETVGTLAGGIAHDFNNIIGTLLGYNEMILEDVPETSTAAEYLGHMARTMNRAKTLVNKMLAFSKNMEAESRLVDLENVLEEALGLFKPSISSNIKISRKQCKKCKPVMADPSQMQQVFMNLLNNAAQALSDNGGKIEISMRLLENPLDLYEDHPGLVKTDYIEFIIKDDGPGIQEKVMERIFEPFFTTKEVGEGTGLGLAVVHGIVSGHNGIIDVDSAPGKGTIFKVYIPAF